MLLSGLAPEVQMDPRPLDAGVPGAQRRQSEGLVRARVLLVADPFARPLEKSHDRRENLLAREARPGEVALDPRADARQRAAEVEHPVVLGAVPLLAPARVVAVLLAAPR